MTNEGGNKEPQGRNPYGFLALGIVAGGGIGLTFGIGLDNVGAGVLFGIGIGLPLGMVWWHAAA